MRLRCLEKPRAGARRARPLSFGSASLELVTQIHAGQARAWRSASEDGIGSRLLHSERRDDRLAHVLHVESLEGRKRSFHVQEREEGLVLAIDPNLEATLSGFFRIDRDLDRGRGSFHCCLNLRRPRFERASAFARLYRQGFRGRGSGGLRALGGLGGLIDGLLGLLRAFRRHGQTDVSVATSRSCWSMPWQPCPLEDGSQSDRRSPHRDEPRRPNPGKAVQEPPYFDVEGTSTHRFENCPISEFGGRALFALGRAPPGPPVPGSSARRGDVYGNSNIEESSGSPGYGRARGGCIRHGRGEGGIRALSRDAPAPASGARASPPRRRGFGYRP